MLTGRDRAVLADARSTRVEPRLPGKAIDPGTTAAVNRQFLEPVRGCFRKRPPWRDLPERVSIWTTYSSGSAAGWFQVTSGAHSTPVADPGSAVRLLLRPERGTEPHLSFTCTSGPAIAAVEVRSVNESDARRRSQDLCVQFLTHDAPRADELVVAPGTAMPSRPNHRVGDRSQDLEDLGHYVDNPTAVRGRRRQLHSCRHRLQAVPGSRRGPASGGVDGASQQTVGDVALPRL